MAIRHRLQCRAHPTLASAEEKTHLKHAQIALRKAAFVKLQRDLVKLEKSHKKAPLKPAALLDKILEILSRCDFSSYDGESAEDLNAGLSAPHSFSSPSSNAPAFLTGCFPLLPSNASTTATSASRR
ncbi:MAG: hypothetical protein WEB53_07600 [Akkermansiaceae bacterium]